MVDKDSLTLLIDGKPVAIQVTRAGIVTTVTLTPGARFVPGSQHPFRFRHRTRKIRSAPKLLHRAGAAVPTDGTREPAGSEGFWSAANLECRRGMPSRRRPRLRSPPPSPALPEKLLDIPAPVINYSFTRPERQELFPDESPFPGGTRSCRRPTGSPSGGRVGSPRRGLDDRRAPTTDSRCGLPGIPSPAFPGRKHRYILPEYIHSPWERG